MDDLTSLIISSNLQNNPISKAKEFFDRQTRYKIAQDIQNWRFVGYVLELGYETAKIITNDTCKITVGGIPRGSYLIMVPAVPDSIAPHFTLLRVTGVAPTPLSMQVQQTYFEMQKRSMPELDLWTQAELQWGALECDVLGMFYADPQNLERIHFSGDINNVVSAHRYEVFSPDEELLTLIVNGTVKQLDQISIGTLRTMECLFEQDKQKTNRIPVNVSMRDFMGCRTAMFGKTRLGKSNVVKLLVQGMINVTNKTRNVGQIIFDVNGEYANDNSQDGNTSIYSANKSRCEVYALTKRPGTPSKELKLNFYEDPSNCKDIIGTLLAQDKRDSIYISNFASVSLSDIDDIVAIADMGEKIRAIRKIQIYWAILHESGFFANQGKLKGIHQLYASAIKPLEPHFNEEIRKIVYGTNVPEQPNDLEGIVSELKSFVEYERNNTQLVHKSKPVFDRDDLAMLDFLFPKSGSGPAMLAKYKPYHSANASDFVKEILDLLSKGQTVILDLGNANDKIRRYFSDMLSKAVFARQEDLFVNNNLGDNYIELYFEEAHNLFPPDAKDWTDAYSRFAKEGAKFHIGMVYSTQSPSTINKELLVQTENFFVGHLSSQDETRALTRMQIAFSGVEQDILRSRTPGYMRMLTLSHRFVIPVQADLYQPNEKEN